MASIMKEKSMKEWLAPYEPYESDDLSQLGANALVFRVVSKKPTAPHKDMVVKLLRLGFKGTADYKTNLGVAEDEYQTMVQLRDVAWVAEVYEKREVVLEDKRTFFGIQMEYCGETLLSLCKKNPNNFEMKLKSMRQLGIALQELQHRKMTHYDIKPENVTYKDGLIKIIDFGTTMIVNSTTTFVRNLPSGKVKGFTKAYAPPELLAGGEAPMAKIDVYCFGKSFYKLFYNRDEAAIEEELNSYWIRDSKEPTKFIVKKPEYERVLENLTKSTIPYDPKPGLYTQQLNGLLRKCMAWNPAERPEFLALNTSLASLESLPVGRLQHENVYRDLAQLCFFNPSDKSLYLLNPQIATLSTGDSNFRTHVKKIAVDYPKDDSCFTTICTPKGRVFAFGGVKNNQALNTVYEIGIPSGKAQLLSVKLNTPRSKAALAANLASVFVLGGEQLIGDAHMPCALNQCEDFRYNDKTLAPLPPLSEAKADMAACVFNNYVYVFGGEGSEFFLHEKLKLLHDYSRKVERLDLGNRSKWETVAIANEAASDWGGCGEAAAVALEDSIMIVGGFICNKPKDDCDWGIFRIDYNPTTSSFGRLTPLVEWKVQGLMNNGYYLKNGIILCSQSLSFSNSQSFYTCQPGRTELEQHLYTQ